MLNNLPLHALIVHMPIALTVLVPLFALLGLWLGRRVMKPHVAWAFPVGMLALLLASGVAADKTGEQQEDKVERVVPEAALERHEEAAAEVLVCIHARARAGPRVPPRASAMPAWQRGGQGPSVARGSR